MDSFIVLTLFVIYLFIYNAYARPFRVRKQVWLKTHLAHRGLYSKDQRIPENSISAFKKAKDLGYGSELDVSLSQEGQLMVFHDEDLMRMCGVNKSISDLNQAQLQQIQFNYSKESIPTLQEVLDLIDGSVPLMIEVKPTDKRRETVSKLKDALNEYRGNVALVSFDPYLVLEFKKQVPQYLRGLIMEPSLNKKTLKFYQRLVLHYALSNALTQADFISVHHSHPSLSISLNRWMKAFIASWTINSQELENTCQNRFDCLIFEHYLPESDRTVIPL